MDEPHADETQPDQAKTKAQTDTAPPAGTAGVGNTDPRTPQVEGGQPMVGEDDVRDTRNTEF